MWKDKDCACASESLITHVILVGESNYWRLVTKNRVLNRMIFTPPISRWERCQLNLRRSGGYWRVLYSTGYWELTPQGYISTPISGYNNFSEIWFYTFRARSRPRNDSFLHVSHQLVKYLPCRKQNTTWFLPLILWYCKCKLGNGYTSHVLVIRFLARTPTENDYWLHFIAGLGILDGYPLRGNHQFLWFVWHIG